MGDRLDPARDDSARALPVGSGPPLARLGFASAASASPILAVRLPREGALVARWTGLLEHGVYVNLALPPTTPRGVSRLRGSACAEHTLERLDRDRDAVAEVAGAPAA